MFIFFFFFQAEDGIRDYKVTGVQTCALPILVIFATVATGTHRNCLQRAHSVLYPVVGATRRLRLVGRGENLRSNSMAFNAARVRPTAVAAEISGISSGRRDSRTGPPAGVGGVDQRQSQSRLELFNT